MANWYNTSIADKNGIDKVWQVEVRYRPKVIFQISPDEKFGNYERQLSHRFADFIAYGSVAVEIPF